MKPSSRAAVAKAAATKKAAPKKPAAKKSAPEKAAVKRNGAAKPVARPAKKPGSAGGAKKATSTPKKAARGTLPARAARKRPEPAVAPASKKPVAPKPPRVPKKAVAVAAHAPEAPPRPPVARPAPRPKFKPLAPIVEFVAPPPPPPPPKPVVTLTVATRQSALAMVQTELAVAHLMQRLEGFDFRILPLVTTGDRQLEWSLEQEGGKGLFIGELESALLEGRADIAIHSAKDLPTDETAGLVLAGFLPREDPRDVLVIRKELPRPNSVATGSPRRRQQLARQFTKAVFSEIRGNVETRIRKILEGVADSTVLAQAGLNRLKIHESPGMRFQVLPLAVSVPAVGQGAVAVQCRPELAAKLAPALDEVTRRAVLLERAFLRKMGGGCHTAFAVHYDGIGVHLFHDACGYQRFSVTPEEAVQPERVAARILGELKLDV
ncbi:hydroxymethylbilane synthase [Congregicoccus parvus]|uniref:hydroxymethylbilane synthase n=1 Tax=Congregicoccus parvus TaxID=3081749 RepID=UPI003FA61138